MKYTMGSGLFLFGDLQLAFVLFLSLGCFQSFELWYVLIMIYHLNNPFSSLSIFLDSSRRDLLTMLSLTSPSIVDKHSALFQQLLCTLYGQIQRFDEDLFTVG